jgi:drug/metabolite transporter (DMT)-like permease
MSSAKAGRGNRHFRGVAFIVLAVMCFAALDTSTKRVALVVPVVMLMWVRCLFQTVLTCAALLPSRGRALFHTRKPGLQFLRGVLLLLCSVCGFFSLLFMPVGEFTAIIMVTPLVITVMAALLLHEPVSWLRWCCVVGGFVGCLVVIRPGSEAFHWAMLLPLLLVAANTGYQLLTSHLSKTEDPGTLHFYTGLVGLLITTVALPWVWQSLSLPVWGLVMLVAAFGTLGHFVLILAYARAPVVVLTPYLYLQVGFAALGGWLVFSHVPDAWALAGIAIITASGVLGTWLTGRESRAQAAHPPVPLA